MTKSNEVELVFTPYITLKNGHRIYARQYGKKVFCFPKKRTESTKKIICKSNNSEDVR